MLTEGLAAGREMPGYRVLDHLEQHGAVAGCADLELVEQLDCLAARFAQTKRKATEKEKQTHAVGAWNQLLLCTAYVLEGWCPRLTLN